MVAMIAAKAIKLNGVIIDRGLRESFRLRKDLYDSLDSALSKQSPNWNEILNKCVQIDSVATRWGIFQQIYNHKVVDQDGTILATLIKQAAFVRLLVKKFTDKVEEASLSTTFRQKLKEELVKREHELTELEKTIDGLNLTWVDFDHFEDT